MGIALVKIKIMPESPETDLEKIKKEVKKLLEQNNSNNSKFEIQPIAFGIKALIVTFSWPEEKELDSLKEAIKKIEHINSIEVIDMRRAMG